MGRCRCGGGRRKHGWFDKLDDAAHRASDAGSSALHAAENAGDALLNVGHHAIDHPDELLQMAGDTAELGLSALALTAGTVGEVGGTALDATGVGAVAGVSINAISAGLLGTGVALGAHGARRWGRDATTMWNEAQEEAAGSSPVRKGPVPDAVPRNLPEQLALRAAREGQGAPIMGKLADLPRLQALYGPGRWVKMQYVLEGAREKVVVHYFRNVDDGAIVEFKFK